MISSGSNQCTVDDQPAELTSSGGAEVSLLGGILALGMCIGDSLMGLVDWGLLIPSSKSALLLLLLRI